jgi:hypothetical protein
MLADEFQQTPKYCQRSPVISPVSAKASEINLFKISAVAYRLLSKKKNHDNLRTKLLWFIYAVLDTAHPEKNKTL